MQNSAYKPGEFEEVEYGNKKAANDSGAVVAEAA
jgi:hypothetical protein